MQEGLTRAEYMEQLRNREDLQNAVRELREDLDGKISSVDAERMEEPGSFGPWSFKDIVAHLTGWRLITVERLEAALGDREPSFPWPSHLREGKDTDEINQWFYETNRDKPLDAVLAESGDTFDRIERAIAGLSEEDLFDPDRFPWLHGYRLGPGVVSGMYFHYFQDHEPEIRKWVERG
ncbi:MAG: ClbS/DfsB family four-helix bundle protein [Chloroflexota bacterium]